MNNIFLDTRLCKNNIHGCINIANPAYQYHYEYAGYCSLCRRSEMYPIAMPENLDILLRSTYHIDQLKLQEEVFTTNLKKIQRIK